MFFEVFTEAGNRMVLNSKYIVRCRPTPSGVRIYLNDPEMDLQNGEVNNNWVTVSDGYEDLCDLLRARRRWHE